MQRGEAQRVYKSRFGEPEPMPVSRFSVALLYSQLRTVAGDDDGKRCRYSAAAPATCGDAIEVPLIVLVAVVLVYHAERIELPGAKMLTQLP